MRKNGFGFKCEFPGSKGQIGTKRSSCKNSGCSI